jgi:regulatory protein
MSYSAYAIKPERKTKNHADKPRKVDAGYLHRAALYYLQRYAATRVRLGEVLQRKVARRLCLKSLDAEAVRAWWPEIEKLLDRYEETGLLNDAALAATRVNNLRAGGRSARDIQNKLRQKGFAPTVIAETLAHHEAEEGVNDAAALQKFMQKKRLGPFRRPEKVADEKQIKKEVAALLRAGFAYELVRPAMAYAAGDD